MHQRTPVALVFLSILTLHPLGCRKPTKESSDTIVETSPMTSVANAAIIEKPSETPPAYLDKRSAALTMGCPEDKITEDGCKSCVGKWSIEGEDGNLVQELSLRPGKYSDSGKAQVFITYFGCGSRAGGDRHNVLLERDEDAWKIAQRSTYKDHQTCQYLKQADGVEHILCSGMHGSQGVITETLTSPGFSNYEAIDATGDEPELVGFGFGGLVFISSTNDEMEEDENGMLPEPPEVKIIKVEDIDGDGDQDARVSVGDRKLNLMIDRKARTMTLTDP